ncbi:MAG: PAS domain S-box protein [Pseudomonadales bacterium]|jgi:PAS domain S-box-containing protein|nr:PAS domain S-box protein [Pseudomonadales bacterium]
MLEALIETARSGRVDAAYLLLGLLLAIASATSAQGLADRIYATRQAPFAYGRVISVLVSAIGILCAQLIMLAAIEDARLFEPDFGARAGAWIVVGLTVLLASVLRADEDAVDDARPRLQLLVFAAACTLLHQIGVLERVAEGWSGLRVATALGTLLASVLMVLPFLHLFVARSHARRSALPVGVIMGLAGTVPFAVGDLLMFALRSEPAPPLTAAQLAARESGVLVGLLFVAVVHGTGWVLAWRASARQALARREVRLLEVSLDALLDDTPDWLAVLSEDGRVLATGGRWERGPLARSPEPGEPLLEALEGTLRDDLGRLLDDARRTPGTAVRGEVGFLSAEEGRPETAELRIVDRSADPQVRGVIVVARSRTEQLARQEEFENQRRLYLEIFARAPVPMFVIDAGSHRIIDVNPAVVDLYGWSREELVGRDAEQIVVPDEHESIRDFREAVHRGAEGHSERLSTHRRKDGSRFGVRVVGSQFRESGVLRRLVMVQDVDSFVREGALQSGEIQLLQTLARSEDVGAWLGAMVDWLGEYPVGEQQVAVLWLDGDNTLVAGRGIRPESERWLGKQRPRDLESALLTEHPVCLALGEGCEEGIWALPVRDATGAVLGAVGAGPCTAPEPPEEWRSLLEIAARLAALAAERELSTRVLRHAQRMETLGRVAGGVAHDFNNLLTVILGEADLLREAPVLDDEARGNVDNILESAHRASRIARRLLAMSRRQPQHQQEVDVRALLGEADQWLGGVLGEGVEVSVTLPETALAVACDRDLLESSLLNLAMNARDAMNGTGALGLASSQIEVTEPLPLRSGTLGPGRYAVISVRDEGPGMAEDVLGRALDPFFTTKAGAGTGLGLPMVANFAMDNGGALSLDSDGAGTLARIWLPLSGPTAKPVQELAPDDGGGSTRVLVVEDEPLVGRFVTRSLGRAGYDVELLGTADEACAVLAAGEGYDLVLSDIGLPGRMDGIDLARWIARERPDVRVLLSSGYASEGLPEDVTAAMLPKPYDARTLARTVEALLAGDADPARLRGR